MSTGAGQRRVAWLVVAASTLIAPLAHAAEPEVTIGGYHDEALRAAQDEWLGLSVGTTERDRAEPLAFALGGGDPSALTNFTPRFGGLGAAASDTQHPGLVNQGQPGPTRQVEIGLGDTSTIAGFAVDWSAKANVGQEAAGQPGGPSSLVVGGELAVSGVRFDAAYGERSTVLGVSGSRMTAGVAYGFGPVDTRVSYSVVTDDDTNAASMLSLGSRLMLQPGLVLQGDLAYAEKEDTSDAATAGVVSLRFNF
jgi:hypothetical protein